MSHNEWEKNKNKPNYPAVMVRFMMKGRLKLEKSFTGVFDDSLFHTG